MKQKWQDKIHNHEFPLQESDWEAMQKRIVEGAPTKRKPFGLFFNIKNLIVMSSIIILIVALWQWAQRPIFHEQKEETQSVRVLNETKTDKIIASNTGNNNFPTVLPIERDTNKPQTLLLTPKIKQNQRVAKPILTDSIKYNTKSLKGGTRSIENETLLNDSLPVSLPFSEKVNLGLLQQEKAYLHLDRTLFKPDEDIWFAMYLRDANTLQPSQQSQILYVELLAPNGNVQESRTYLVFDGTAAGDFHLPSTLKGGIYKLRAYTNWMKNTNDAFEREITLQAVVLPNLRMKLEFERKAYGAGDEVMAKFDVSNLENRPLQNTELTFNVSLAGTQLLNNTTSTNDKGRAYVKFNLPKDLETNDGILNITLPYNGQTEAISRSIPIVLNKIDLQFLPEGGEIAADLSNRIAFKALNEFGKPADIEGIVKNSNNEIVAHFNSFHDSMGAFRFLPKADEKYTAYITKPEGIKQQYVLPKANPQGATLSVVTQKNNLQVTLASQNTDFETAYVVAQMNDKILFEKAITLNSQQVKTLEIPTSDWPIGIARVTLFDKKGTPRNERITFVNRHKSLNINIKTNKSQYQPREKVSMTIKVSDDKGQPVKGNFSLAVADDAQLTFADDKQGHILAALLLESELKGKIEEPNFYFDTKEEKSLEALDYLMLTQGWRRFEWKDAGKEKEIVAGYKFGKEKAGYKGIVLDEITQKPVANLPISAVHYNLSTKTNDKGEFEFSRIIAPYFSLTVLNNTIIVTQQEDQEIVLHYNDGEIESDKYRTFGTIPNSFLKGKITDERSGEKIINAHIRLMKRGIQQAIVTTDSDGNYSARVNGGIYDVEISYYAIGTKIIKDVLLKNGTTTTLNSSIINEKSRVFKFLNQKDNTPIKGLDVKFVQNLLVLETNEKGTIEIPNIDLVYNNYMQVGNQQVLIDLKDNLEFYVNEDKLLFGENNRVANKSSMLKYKGKLANLYGKVTDENTKRPIEGALVVLKKGKEDLIELTDGKGNFNLDIAASDYEIEVSAQGYRISTYNIHLSDSNIVNLSLNLIKEDTIIVQKELYIAAANNNKTISVIHGKSVKNTYNYSKNQTIVNSNNSATIQGKVIEGKTGDDAINAYVKLLRNGVAVTTVATDFEGNYTANVNAGVYDVEVSYVGMTTELVKKVILNGGRITLLNFILQENNQVLDAVHIVEYKVPLVQRDNTTAGGTVTSEQIKNMPTRNVTAIVGLTSGVSTNRDGDIQIKGTRKEGTVYMVDGVRIQAAGGLPPAQEIDQLQVITGGVPAQFADLKSVSYGEDDILKDIDAGNVSLPLKPQYGNLTGGIIKLKTKGPAQRNEIQDNSTSGSTVIDEQRKTLPIRNIVKIYGLARTFYAPIYTSKDAPEVRNDFRSTIFWQPNVVTDEKGEANIEFYNSDALTTFRATLEGIGTTGTAGRNEYRYSTKQLLNLSAKAPDKVLTGDVVRIPLSLKNNDNQALTGKLKVIAPSNFEAIGEIPSTIFLAASEAKTIYLPYKVKGQSANILGESQTFTIEFEAGELKDKFTTSIKTLSRGFPVTQLFSADKLKNEFAMNLSNPVENTATLILTAYPNALDDILQGMERMLRQPSGCFEQVSSSNYPNLLVLDLLRNTQQFRPDVEKRALEYLADGYKKLTAYECKSGGYDWWGRDPAHEGLTAYGILEFTDMARVYNVDKTMIDRTVKWLLNRRNGKGGWTLNPNALHGWQNDNILDTYICYALAEAGYGKEVSTEIEQIYTQVINQKDAYTQALLANTLFAIGDKNRAKSLINNLLQTQAANGSFIGSTHSVFHAYGQGFTIETTALVALALMKSGENDAALAKAIAYIAQSKSEYGYSNTQSTVMALKALCAYTQQQKHEATDGKIVIFANNKRVAEKAYSKNQLEKLQIAGLEEFMANDKNNIKVIFEGTDKAIPFDIELKYASKLPQNAADSPLKFSTILAQSQAKIGDVVRLSANLENKTNQAVASPIMLIGIPAGLTAQPWQLKQIVDRKECAFYEIFNNYIVFYFDELAPKSLKTIHLDLRSDIGGSYEAPASLAYPYYTNEWRVWSKPEGILVE